MMTPRFSGFMPFILKWECDWPQRKDGEPSNDPRDPGKYTRWGIDATSHPSVDIVNLTYDGAMAIYFSEWQQDGIEPMAPKVGEVYFNACVNCGVSRAQKLLVLASGGTWGDFIDYQESFYRRLSAQRPILSEFLVGWLNRTRDLRSFLSL